MAIQFDILALSRATRARAGMLYTSHGEILTPAFAPVGTQATVKTLSPLELRELGASLVLANTYHLYLRPGPDVIAALGGLHAFMGWPGPLMTDSGGYQVASLARLRRLDDEGVSFTSHLDGSSHRLTPESAIAIQEKLGADIILPLDVCLNYPSDRGESEAALRLTHRWAERSRSAQRRTDQALFGIVQGAFEIDLRRESARFVAARGFAGFSIGGLSVGEPKALMLELLEVTVPQLPDAKPRHLLGVGAPEDLWESVALGVDLFDCSLPTRVARNGGLYTHRGRLNIRNALYARDALPIEEGCGCYACRNFSRAYVRHLFMAEEILGLRLATIHNLYFFLDLMSQMRQAILEGEFETRKASFLASYEITNEERRLRNRAAYRSRTQEASL
jgi:queuine tRNA-ribosyltransferase